MGIHGGTLCDCLCKPPALTKFRFELTRAGKFTKVFGAPIILPSEQQSAWDLVRSGVWLAYDAARMDVDRWQRLQLGVDAIVRLPAPVDGQLIAWGTGASDLFAPKYAQTCPGQNLGDTWCANDVVALRASGIGLLALRRDIHLVTYGESVGAISTYIPCLALPLTAGSSLRSRYGVDHVSVKYRIVHDPNDPDQHVPNGEFVTRSRPAGDVNGALCSTAPINWSELGLTFGTISSPTPIDTSGRQFLHDILQGNDLSAGPSFTPQFGSYTQRRDQFSMPADFIVPTDHTHIYLAVRGDPITFAANPLPTFPGAIGVDFTFFATGLWYIQGLGQNSVWCHIDSIELQRSDDSIVAAAHF